MVKDLNAVYAGFLEAEHKAFADALRSQDSLFRETNGLVTYGEICSFEIARHQGVTAEQFAALPSRGDRMKWLKERNARLCGGAKIG